MFKWIKGIFKKKEVDGVRRLFDEHDMRHQIEKVLYPKIDLLADRINQIKYLTNLKEHVVIEGDRSLVYYDSVWQSVDSVREKLMSKGYKFVYRYKQGHELWVKE